MLQTCSPALALLLPPLFDQPLRLEGLYPHLRDATVISALKSTPRDGRKTLPAQGTEADGSLPRLCGLWQLKTHPGGRGTPALGCGPCPESMTTSSKALLLSASRCFLSPPSTHKTLQVLQSTALYRAPMGRLATQQVCRALHCHRQGLPPAPRPAEINLWPCLQAAASAGG